ncbi:response regulator [Rubritalea spongiae]|uniref:Response regulator n=1 Tax=Rubritalea spongiae TaxID=430797 RepID=A0ABW5DYA9_9BACT
MEKLIEIMLVEDSPEYREVIKLAIYKEKDMRLKGVFGAAEVALTKLQNSSPVAQPDIILLDLSLPGISGLEAIHWIREYTPSSKIIILTQSDREADVLYALSHGASGYLMKASTVSQIIEGIRSVIAGHALIDGCLAKYLTKAIQGSTTEVSFDRPLSNRELEILGLLGEGLLKKEIADRLDIGFGTVATHIRHIYEKLQVENAPAAISKAYKGGLFPMVKKE